jgi:RNA polymerase sigma-70 factor, ECF subfamily
VTLVFQSNTTQWLAAFRMPPMSDSFEYGALNDAALVSRLAQADEAAFSELYDRYSGALYGLALRVCNSQPKAEEIVQDAMMKLWRNPLGFDASKAALSTFLMTLTRNAAIDALRRERFTTPLEDEEGEALPIPSSHTGPLERAELAAVAVKVRAAMVELSDAHRKTVELAYFRGASREEIAAEMNVPVGTVKSRLKYALDKLRGNLSEFAVLLGDA